MLSIYTYPNNSGTGYIDPDYYGSTTGGSETGYYKRILDLKDGTYRAWVTGQTAPVDTVSDLITATGKFHKGVRTENGLENIMIYSYYNQPLITIDSVLINQDISASDTDASPAVRLTVSDSSDFVDGDNVLLTGFDGTLADRNNHQLHVDVINSTTVDLYYDSGLTTPVQYFSSIPSQSISNINFDSATPTTTPVKVTLPTLGSSYDTASFTAASGGNDSQTRLSTYGLIYIDNAVSDVFELYEDLSPADPLTIDEFLNNDYTKDWGQLSGSIGQIDDVVPAEYYISNTLTLSSASIYKIQKKLSTGAWENGLNNLAYEGPYTVNTNGSGDTLVYDYGDNPASDPAKTTNQKATVDIYKNTVVNNSDYAGSEGKFPGPGYFLKPLYDDTGLVQINTHTGCVLSRNNAHLGQPTWDSDIETNSVDGGKFHWYGNSFGQSSTTSDWREFEVINDASTNPLEYTDNGETYHVYTKDANLRGDYVAGDEVSAYISGSPSHPSSNDTVFCSSVVNANATGPSGNTAWVGTVNGADGDPLWRKMKDIWDNNLAEAVYCEIGATFPGSPSYIPGRRVAIWPIEAKDYTDTQGGNTYYGYTVTYRDVEHFDGADRTQTHTISLQTLTFYSDGSTPTVTGGDDVWMQTKDPSAGDPLDIHTPLTVNRTTTSDIEGINTSGGTELRLDSTHDWYDLLHTGTIVKTNNASGLSLVLVETTTSLNNRPGGQKRFTMHRVYVGDWTSGGSSTGKPIPEWNVNHNLYVTGVQAFWTEGENYFTPDTTTDYYYWTGTYNNVRYNETNEMRWLALSDSETGTTAAIGVTGITDSTTGNIALTGTHNHKASNPNVYFPGNQTYKQRTGASTYVNAAIVEDDYYDIDSSTTSDFTDGTKPSLTVSQSTEGYISGISLGSTGRITTGQKMLTIGATPDSYTPPALTPAEQEDVWDTDDEWASDGSSQLKTWPDHVTPRSAVINYSSPTIVNNSQSGIKYTRSVGHTKWRLEVEYPPMSAEDFQEFHVIAQAAHGQSTPFYFKLRSQYGTNILWSDFYDGTSSTYTPRVKDAISPGDTTLLVEGFNSNESNAFKRGEVFIGSKNENGSLHTSLSSTDANVFGEAKIRTPWPFREAKSAGSEIDKDPFWAIVTLGSDNFEYTVDVNNYYYVSVAFDLDSWK